MLINITKIHILNVPSGKNSIKISPTHIKQHLEFVTVNIFFKVSLNFKLMFHFCCTFSSTMAASMPEMKKLRKDKRSSLVTMVTQLTSIISAHGMRVDRISATPKCGVLHTIRSPSSGIVSSEIGWIKMSKPE